MTGQRGLLVSLDGPGGVGKSTVTAAVAEQLRAAGLPVLATREPTDTPLGTLARHGTDTYRGLAMAHLIAADRYHHLDTEIRPALARGEIVLSDRYLASSLVLQVMDGVDRQEAWQINRHADLPDLAVLLTAHPDILTARLAQRGTHSRYERLPNGSVSEHRLFALATTTLAEAGVRVLELDATSTPPASVARTITTAITDLYRRGADDQPAPADLPGRADLQPQPPQRGAG
ncbi:dTMP kinase [Streptomyces mayteni]